MAKFSLDSSYIEVIAKILKEHDLREISLNDEKSRITIKRGEKRIYSSALPMQQPIPLAESSQEARQAAAGAHLATAAGQKEESGEEGGVVVPAPVVGNRISIAATNRPAVRQSRSKGQRRTDATHNRGYENNEPNTRALQWRYSQNACR